MATTLSRNYTVDSLLELKAAGLVAASAAGTLILDVGDAYVDGVLVLDVSALEIASNDEAYTIVLQGSPDDDFGTAGNITELARVHLGAKETKLTDCDKDDATGRYVIPFINEQNGTVYRYLRVYTVVAGSIATGINYTARLGKAPAM